MITNQKEFDWGALPEFVPPKSDEECKDRLNNLTTILGLTMSEKAYECGGLHTWVKDTKPGRYLAWLTENIKAFKRTTDWRNRSFYEACKSENRLLDFTSYNASRKGEAEEEPCFNLKHEAGSSELPTTSQASNLPAALNLSDPHEDQSECGDEYESDDKEEEDSDISTGKTSGRQPHKPTKIEIERKRCRKEMIVLAQHYKESHNVEIRCGAFQDEGSKILDVSVGAIITDIPWPGKYLYLVPHLRELAKRVLKPGGFVITYGPKNYHDKVIQEMCQGKDLEYHNEFVVLFQGGPYPILGGTNIISRYDSILCFCKPPQRKSMPLIHDVIIRTKPEKTLHKWQQPEGDLDKIIDVFTRPGDLILDVCAGSGTTLAVCLKKGRRCIGIELDEENVEVIKGRLTKVKHELTVQGIKGSVAEVAQAAA